MAQMSESKNTDDSPDYWISHEQVSKWHDQIQEDIRQCMTPKYSITRLHTDSDTKPKMDWSPFPSNPPKEFRTTSKADKIAGIENTITALRNRIERLERQLRQHQSENQKKNVKLRRYQTDLNIATPEEMTEFYESKKHEGNWKRYTEGNNGKT